MLEVKDQPFDKSPAARSVDEKLSLLRNNPAARAELAARVDGYKQQEKGWARPCLSAFLLAVQSAYEDQQNKVLELTLSILLLDRAS